PTRTFYSIFFHMVLHPNLAARFHLAQVTRHRILCRNSRVAHRRGRLLRHEALSACFDDQAFRLQRHGRRYICKTSRSKVKARQAQDVDGSLILRYVRR
ncbi:hypothetical protein C8J56DRAFT_909179, partial [Mycena floridula]